MDDHHAEHHSHHRLLLAGGAFLVLLGLLSGLMTGLMANPRMGLSAHLEGLLNGILLIALGCAWRRLALPVPLRRAALWLVLYGAFANFVFTQLGALWGTGRLTPLAAPRPQAADWQELVVAIGLGTLSAAMIAAFAILAVGFWRGR